MRLVFVLGLSMAGVGAKAGVPTMDNANLFNNIQNNVQQLLAWSQQAQDMLKQAGQLQAQINQMKDMTNRLEGMRNLGSILQDPSVRSLLPKEFNDASTLLMNPGLFVTNPAAVSQTLAGYGIKPVSADNPQVAGTNAADSMGKLQQILQSTQARNAQISKLGSRADVTIDAKESMDLVNRNVLEAAAATNQQTETIAAIEFAKRQAILREIAAQEEAAQRRRVAAALPLAKVPH